MSDKAEETFLAHVIYDAMVQDDPNCFIGCKSDLETEADEIIDADAAGRVTIDGHFNLKHVARQILAALRARDV